MKQPSRIYSLSQISFITGKSHHTVRDIFKRSNIEPEIKNDLGTFYDTARVLPVIYNEARDPKDIKAQREKEELEFTRAKREKTEVETALLTRDLISAEEAVKLWTKIVIALKTKLLTLPGKCALQVQVAQSPEESEYILKECVYDALTELSNLNPSDITAIDIARTDNETPQESSTTTETDSQ